MESVVCKACDRKQRRAEKEKEKEKKKKQSAAGELASVDEEEQPLTSTKS